MTDETHDYLIAHGWVLTTKVEHDEAVYDLAGLNLNRSAAFHYQFKRTGTWFPGKKEE